MADDESILPAYEPANKDPGPRTTAEMGASSAHGDRSLDGLPSELSSLPFALDRSIPQICHTEPRETFMYTYNLFAGNARLQIFVLVRSEPGRRSHYILSLSMKLGHVERAISKPVTMRLSVDPRRLDFIVFAFTPRSSLPTGCLFHIRVWLRTTGVDHRVFAEKDLWFGKDPDFGAIAGASFARLLNAAQDILIYQALVGRAHVSFVVRWKRVQPGVYALSLDYSAGGAGRTLFEDHHLRLSCEPRVVSFLIYSIPVPSTPPGASHRLRVWLRTPHMVSRSPSSSGPSFPTEPHQSQSYLYQRLWKMDDFKIGAHLSFESIGSKIILATRQSDDPCVDPTLMPLTPNRRRVSRNVGVDDTEESVDDR